MHLDPAQISEARALVEAVLAGSITRHSDPAVFDLDLLFKAVTLLERTELDWLGRMLADTSIPLAARVEVATATTSAGLDAQRASLLAQRDR